MMNLPESEKVLEKRGDWGTVERKEVRAEGSVKGLKVGMMGIKVVMA